MLPLIISDVNINYEMTYTSHILNIIKTSNFYLNTIYKQGQSLPRGNKHVIRSRVLIMIIIILYLIHVHVNYCTKIIL